jgi:hypothetical protein
VDVDVVVDELVDVDGDGDGDMAVDDRLAARLTRTLRARHCARLGKWSAALLLTKSVSVTRSRRRRRRRSRQTSTSTSTIT